MAASLKRTEYYYASDNALQNVAVWQFPDDQLAKPTPGTKKYWLIFIHGGAWRDPRGTFNEAEPTIDALLTPSAPGGSHHLAHDPSARIAGFASLNYRLSPHPQYAQDLAQTPYFGTRTAAHPDHLRDVLAGLRFLQQRFGFGSEYVLFGHSAGAFLGYQLLLGAACLGEQQDPGQGGSDGGGGGGGGEGVVASSHVDMPVAVVGFEGIYDLVGLNERMNGTYAGFMEAAFGKDEGGSWKAASPATAGGSFNAWSQGVGKLAVLAHSPDDELVDMAECDTMEARLREDGVESVKVYRDLKGGHFEVLRDGSFARVIKEAWAELELLDKAQG